MTTKDDVARDYQKLFDSKEIVGKYWNALIGDGAGVVADANNPALTWVRYLTDQSKTSKVANPLNLSLVEDIPVIIGRRFPDSEYEEILAINLSLYVRTMDTAAVQSYSKGKHGDDHNAASGTDPASIDLRNIVEMRGRPRTVPDLTILVEKGQYQFGSTIKRFPSGIIDLTASVPGGIGHCYVLVYVDGVTNLLASTASVTVPLAATPPIPAVPVNTISICVVDLENGQITITEDDIFDWRFLWRLASFEAPAFVGTNAARLLLVVATLAELTRFYTTDTDKIWEIWEGAWRLIYPPAALSESDGDAGTPWTTSATGILTGTQDLVLDDGVGDSPALLWRGGSNNDEIQMFLNDDAVATHSDVVLNLADNDGDSEFRVTDFNSNIKFQLTSEGDFTQTVENAVTNTTTDFQTLTHLTTGAAAAGFGIRQLFKLEDDGGAEEDAAAMAVTWENAGAAAEGTLITFSLRKAGVALGPFVQFGATENVFNIGNADVDFRVASDTITHALFVNGANGRVGIGTSTPDSTLDISATAGSNAAISINDGDMAANAYGTLFNPPVAATTVARIANWSTGSLVLNGFAGTDNEPGVAIVGYTMDTTPVYPAVVITGWKPNGADARQVLAGTDKVLQVMTGLAPLITVQGDGKMGIGAAAPGSLMELNFATEDLEFVDAGSVAATGHRWIECQVGGVTTYIRTFAAK